MSTYLPTKVYTTGLALIGDATLDNICYVDDPKDCISSFLK